MKTSAMLLFGIVFFFTASTQLGLAHSGHKKEAPVAEPEPTGPTDSIYAIDSPATDELGLSLPGGKDLFGPNDTMPEMGEMNHDEGQHGDKPMIEHAKREWNSSERSGYGAAWGLTILSAAIFGFLIRKPPTQ